MKTVRSQSDLIPRSFPEIKRLIQNINIGDDVQKNEECQCGNNKITNRQIGLVSTNLLKPKCCCQKLQQPIILEKRNRCSQIKKTKKTQIVQDVPERAYYSPKTTRPVKPIEKFQPIMIPTHDKKVNVEAKLTVNSNPPNKQQIEIHLQNSDKDCLKKLFKKISKLTDDLHQSEKKNTALSTQLDHLKGNSKKIAQLQKENLKLKGQIQKLKAQLSVASSKTIQKIIQKPIEVIKHVPVQKIVQIQVPKYIPGPQKIIEKIVEVEKKTPYETNRQIHKETARQVYNHNNPQQNHGTSRTQNIGASRPHGDYFQYPIYRNSPYPFEVPVQVPVHVPVYIDKPGYGSNNDMMGFYHTRTTTESSELHKQNAMLNRQNEQLYKTIDILKKHNQQKNRQVQALIQGQIISSPTNNRMQYQAFNTFYR